MKENRIFDLLDIVRACVCVGPGVAVGVRATDAVDFYFGSYLSAYVALPGPRQRKIPPSPLGVESYSGAEVSLLKATTGLGMGPEYSFPEIVADAQIGLVGFDVAVDPAEILDLIAGIFTFDIMDDDF